MCSNRKQGNGLSSLQRGLYGEEARSRDNGKHRGKGFVLMIEWMDGVDHTNTGR